MTTTLSTTNYEMFTFRDDNRQGIKLWHVEKLKKSISAKNLLYMAPISVNKDMQIINGQHRYLAAKELGVPLYYIIQEDFKPEDMLAMNTAISWTTADVFHFYCKNGYVEYQKLDKYIKSTGVPVSTALRLVIGERGNNLDVFKSGKFVYETDPLKGVEMCKITIDKIKKIKGSVKCQFTKSSRFWSSLLRLVNHPDFDQVKWLANLDIQMENLTAKAGSSGYFNMFINIFNWRNHNKIKIEKEGEIYK